MEWPTSIDEKTELICLNNPLSNLDDHCMHITVVFFFVLGCSFIFCVRLYYALGNIITYHTMINKYLRSTHALGDNFLYSLPTHSPSPISATVVCMPGFLL